LAVAIAPDPEEGFIIVPYQALPEIAGSRCSFLDDIQTLVQETGPEDWPEIVRKAREHEVQIEFIEKNTDDSIKPASVRD